ncbi:MAG: ROK family protein [Chloroflexi bacterium]|nr:MAG: ROK family protein [Chloroflexota bacterium]RPI96548.1 MAG: ROK family protein [Chloroflexota bacterium]
MKKNDRLRTGDSALVRQINLSVIMNNLRKKAPISRAGLAQATGLNKTTVSSLVDELLQRQFVRENGFITGGRGHPAIMLDLNPAAGFMVGCEIGVDFILVVCTNFAPEIIWRHEERTDPGMGQPAILDRARALLNEAIKRGYLEYGTLLGIGVGVAALIDQSTGTMLFAPNLGWKDPFPIRAMLQESFPQAPLIVDNEANIAALGENYFGVAQDHDEVLYISAGVGLGGGIVHGGQVFSGVAGVGAEFGHMTMDPDGELCSCGNFGCWETQVSQRALFRHIRKSFEQGEMGTLFQLTNGGVDPLTVPTIVDAARAGDTVALGALEKIGRDLGIGIASLVNALNPELVVFGGVLSLAGEFLMPALIKELEQRALRWNREAAEVVLAEHGFDAAAMGGVAAVYETILAQPNLMMGSLE